MQLLPEDIDAVTDAVLVASRALVAIAARSLGAVEHDLTLPQYRALVVLANRGPQLVGALAEQLDVNPSTATRLCDRLVRKNLILRRTASTSRREIEVELSPQGGEVVDRVARRRRMEVMR